ncbi:MAG: MotA/TolQ/ExbB proton channel family protein [Lachnospiraceae bacterium]|nr:MotA/TolQ/ExbB proton channel family protein [Lachnospiraceae bacterium]
MVNSIIFWGSNAFIVILGLVVWSNLNRIHREIVQDHDEARSIYNKTVGESVVNIASGIYGYSEQIEFDIKDMDPIRKKYNEHNTSYLFWAQLISLFPLLGLLGTIIGLIPGLQQVKAGEFDLLYSSLSTALWTTLCGLVASIILKIVSSSHGKTMNSIEDYFEENDRKYSQAIGLGKVTARDGAN